MDRDHLTDWFRMYLNRWIAIAGDILDTCTQIVGILYADHGSVIAYAQKNSAADGIGKGHKFSRERRRKSLLELKGCPFPLLDKDFEVVKCHAGASDCDCSGLLSALQISGQMSCQTP